MTRKTAATGRKNSPRFQRASTESRMKRRTGPRSLAGMLRSSPVCIARYSRSRCALARSRLAFLVAGATRGRLFAASETFRFGVGRPLPASVGGGVLSDSAGVTGWGSLLRPNTPPG